VNEAIQALFAQAEKIAASPTLPPQMKAAITIEVISAISLLLAALAILLWKFR
jgi:hypothetical protein